MTPASKRYSRYFTYIEPALKAPIVRTYGSLILTFLSLTIFVIFAIKPTVETILVLQKKLADQQAILKQIVQKGQDLRTGIENYHRLDETARQKVDTAVPKNLELAVVVRSLEQAAVLTEASISALQFQPITMEKPAEQSFETHLVEIPFTFNVEGSYDKQKKVLQNLGKSPRLISITGLIFNKIEGGLLMSVSGKAYYLK